MKTNRMMTMIGAVLLVMMMAASSSFAQRERSLDRMGERLERALSKLELTDEQKEEIKVLRENFRAANEGVMAEIERLKDQAQQERGEGNRDGAKETLSQAREKVEGLKSNAQNLREDILGVLTQAQRDQLEQMKEERGAKGRGKCKERVMKLMNKLDLTDQQKEELAALREEFQKEHADEREEIQRLKGQLKELCKNGDKEGAVETRNQLQALVKGMQEDREKLREGMMNILTEEQKMKLEELMEDRKEKREDRNGRRGIDEGNQTEGAIPEIR